MIRGDIQMLRVKSSLPQETDELIHRVIGAAIEVHRILGPGYLECVYEEALCHEFKLHGIRFERQKDVVVEYKDIQIRGQRIDLVVEDALILELKAVDEIPPVHEAKLLSYMKTLNVRAGLMIN
jgi:GxxExxY protein